MPSPPRFLALVALLVLCFTLRLGAPGFWEKDEGRYAQAAREMRRSGDLLVPTLGGVTRLNKPPLVYWLIAGSQEVLGENEFASRLPSATAGLLTALLVFLLARRLGGKAAGWFASLAYATCVLGAGMGRLAHPESWFCLFVTASVTCFYLAYRDGFRRRRLLVAAWLAAGGGLLVKGPHGVLLPVLVIAAFLLVRKEIRTLGRLMFGRGLLLAVTPVAIWGGLVVAQEGGGVLREWFDETIGRVSGAKDYHTNPPWFFVSVLAGGFLPWTLWIPAAVARFTSPGRRPEGGMLLLVWTAVIFLFFSLSPNKASAYALSMVPPLSVAVGVGLSGLRPGRILTATGALLALTAAGAAGALVLGLPRQTRFYATPAAVVVGVACVSFAATATLALLGRARPAARVAVGGGVVTLLLGMALVAPAANALSSVRQAAVAAREAHREGDRILNVGTKRAALLWYTDLPIGREFESEDLPRIWDRPRRFVVFGKKSWRDALEAEGREVYRIWSHPGRKYCIFSNHP